MAQSYATEYFRSRRMGQMLQQPFDAHAPALKAYRRAARMLGVQPGMRILDAGCGLGAGAWLLAVLGARVTAVDVSPDAIAWARETYGPVPLHKGGSLEYQVADLSAWVPPAAFDAVLVADVLEHFPRAAGPGLLARLLAGLDIEDVPSSRGWTEGLFLHLPITANLIDWPLIVKNGLLRKRLRGQVVDHHGDPTHVARYSLRDVRRVVRGGGGCLTGVELRIYRPRVRPLEHIFLDGVHRHPLLRAGGAFITDCDAVILPELVAALRSAPAGVVAGTNQDW